ncbi:MAG: hypothetical protein ABII71_03155 [Candidatus Micrarchaeota archaeon]
MARPSAAGRAPSMRAVIPMVAFSLVSAFCTPPMAQALPPERPTRGMPAFSLYGSAPAAATAGPATTAGRPFISHTVGGESCGFSAERGTISVSTSVGGTTRVRTSPPLETAPADIAGGYEHLFCGEGRSVILAGERVVVTLGRQAIRDGVGEMPGGLPSFSVPLSEGTGVRMAAHSVSEDAGYFFVLSSQGRLVYSDTQRRGERILQIELGGRLEFPAGEHQAHMIYSDGHLFIFQEGSRRMVEVYLLPEGVVVRPFSLGATCPESPQFSISGRTLSTVFGDSQIRITISRGLNTTIREDPQ